MGNSLSTNPLWYSSDPNLLLCEENLTYISTKTHSHFSQVDEYKHAVAKRVLLCKDILISDQTQLTEENLEKLKARVNLWNENLLDIYGFLLAYSEEGIATISLFFEAFASDASVEFEARRKRKEHFAEEELYESLLNVIKALAFLEKNGISHGNLTPASIFMANDGEIKLLGFSAFEEQQSELPEARNCYLDPEIFSLIDGNQRSMYKIDPWKADLFSLGMVFIYGGLLEEPAACYNWTEHVFDSSKLFNFHEQIRVKYRGRLATLLEQITTVNHNERPSPLSLLNSLKEIEKKGRIDQIMRARTAPSRNSLAKIDDLVKKIQAKTRSQESFYYSPTRRDAALKSPNTGFRDPRVSQIIKEVKEKNWKKFTPYSQRAKSRSPTRYYKNKSKDLLGSEVREKYYFLSTQASPYRDYILKDSFDYEPKRTTRAESPNKGYNRPIVNEIIAEIRSDLLKPSGLYELGYSKRDPRFQKFESTTKSSSFIGLASLLPNNYSNLSKTPERQIFGRDLNKYSIENPNRFSPQNKTQTKEEILQELRAKYGKKSKKQDELIQKKSLETKEQEIKQEEKQGIKNESNKDSQHT